MPMIRSPIAHRTALTGYPKGQRWLTPDPARCYGKRQDLAPSSPQALQGLCAGLGTSRARYSPLSVLPCIKSPWMALDRPVARLQAKADAVCRITRLRAATRLWWLTAHRAMCITPLLVCWNRLPMKLFQVRLYA